MHSDFVNQLYEKLFVPTIKILKQVIYRNCLVYFNLLSAHHEFSGCFLTKLV